MVLQKVAPFVFLAMFYCPFGILRAKLKIDIGWLDKLKDNFIYSKLVDKNWYKFKDMLNVEAS